MIVLTTLNSRYSHAAFGLRYLYANMGPLREQTRIIEYTISQDPRVIADQLIASQPRILGFGVYIWNTSQTLAVIDLIKNEHPEILIVLGGPEVSHEAENQAICARADYVIQGEADFLFREFCEQVLNGAPPSARFIRGPLPEVKEIISPYAHYSDEDVKQRVIYVEVSRGCPYKCEYCLSSLDKSVRAFDLDRFLSDMQTLIDRGVRQFKFVDRTFNLSISTGQRILKFFLEQIHLGLFLHFEMVPDRLPTELRELIVQFPKGSLQFEIGIQTWNPSVAANVSRRQNYEKIKENLAFLKAETGVHTHVDLIVGLPGETLESFAQGFDHVTKLGADEVQVGILKYLKGTPIARHKGPFQMRYSSEPPFIIQSTKDLSQDELQTMTRFAKFWDLIANSGNFQETTDHLRAAPSFFRSFLAIAQFLFDRHGRAYALALHDLAESIYEYWLSQGVPQDEALLRLAADFDRAGRIHRPVFLRSVASQLSLVRQSGAENDNAAHVPSRQRRHLAIANN